MGVPGLRAGREVEEAEESGREKEEDEEVSGEKKKTSHCGSGEWKNAYSAASVGDSHLNPLQRASVPETSATCFCRESPHCHVAG